MANTDIAPTTNDVNSQPVSDPSQVPQAVDNSQAATTAQPADNQITYNDVPHVNPNDILNSPDVSLEDKKSVTDAIDRQNNAQAQQLVTQKATAMNTFQNKLKIYEGLEKWKADNDSDVNIGKRPVPEDFGITTDEAHTMSDPQTQKTIADVVNDKQQQDQQQQQQNQQKKALDAGAQQASLEQNHMLGYAAQNQKLSDEFKQRYDKASKDIDSQDTQLKAIDPNRYISSLNTGGKIFGMLA